MKNLVDRSRETLPVIFVGKSVWLAALVLISSGCASDQSKEIEALQAEIEQLKASSSPLEQATDVTSTTVVISSTSVIPILESTTTTVASPSSDNLRNYLVDVIGRRNCRGDGLFGGTQRFIGGGADSAYLKVRYSDGALDGLGDLLGVENGPTESDYLACMGARTFREAFRGLGFTEDIFAELLVEQPGGREQTAETDEFLATWSFTLIDGLELEISRK